MQVTRKLVSGLQEAGGITPARCSRAVTYSDEAQCRIPPLIHAVHKACDLQNFFSEPEAADVMMELCPPVHLYYSDHLTPRLYLD
ncbi:hypothetical protein ACOMHN_003346 [Nucella lapillus]